jgi:hypothetical protein
MEELTASGHQELLRYVVQQISQVRGQAGELDMSQEDVQVMNDVAEDVRKWFVSEATVEERLEGLSPQELMNTFTPEERLEGLSAEERTKGLSPEERLGGLSPEERKRMKQLLDGE